MQWLNKHPGFGGRLLAMIILLAGAVSMIFPVFWMLTIALKGDAAVMAIPPEWWPSSFHWENFWLGMQYVEFGKRFLNTMIISIASTVGQVLSSVMVGFAFARLRFPGRKIWFSLIIASMMLPPIVGLIPLFRVYKSLGWFNTWWPLIVPNFLGNPFYTFLARQYFSTIPFSYDEAAKIDGASTFQIFFRILMPICKPMLMVIVIFQFQASWNEYLLPLVYLIKPQLWTLSVAIGQYVTEWRIAWNQFMAVDILYMLPVVILYFFSQRYFMEALGSLNQAGVK